MFGGPSNNPPSKSEVKQQEAEALSTIQTVALGSLALYLSPFVVDYVKRLV